MTSTASETATQVTSKLEVSLDDRIAKVCHAGCRLGGAVDDLVRALHALDDEDIPASVRDRAFGMHHAAEQLRDISDRADKLEALADEAAEDDPEAVS